MVGWGGKEEGWRGKGDEDGDELMSPIISGTELALLRVFPIGFSVLGPNLQLRPTLVSLPFCSIAITLFFSFFLNRTSIRSRHNGWLSRYQERNVSVCTVPQFVCDQATSFCPVATRSGGPVPGRRRRQLHCFIDFQSLILTNVFCTVTLATGASSVRDERPFPDLFKATQFATTAYINQHRNR